MAQKLFFAAGVGLLALLLLSPPGYCGEARFLSNNIHAQRNARGQLKASYANWTHPGAGHRIIPVNTPVTVGKWRRGFMLITRDKGEKIYFEYNRRNMRMSVPEYIDLITSPARVSLTRLSRLDRKGIKAGKALRGMSKDGVRIALGYPATHQTPSLEENVWVYWKDRWRRSEVTFNARGKVISVR